MKIVIVGVAILLYAVFFLLLYRQYKEILILKKMIEARDRLIDTLNKRVESGDELIESQTRLIALQDEQIRLLRE